MELKNYQIENEKVGLQDINKIAEESNQVFQKKCVPAVLFDKPIHFSKNIIENYSMDFWHMGSLENKDIVRNSNLGNYYNIKPCNNTYYCNKCSNCVGHTFHLNVRNKSRDKCIYRMSSIDLFHEVISKANNMDDNIKIWKMEDYSQRTKAIILKMRYTEGKIDYLIILNEKEKEYFFVTAYPIFEQREKIDLDKEYQAKNTIKIK